MPNETDAAVNNEAMDETQELPAFPARPVETAGAGVDHVVSAQYKALQEAQFLHEETLRQLREEIQAQKQTISELREENQQSAEPAVRFDAVLLRLSELERKVGQDAPDPLLNEIVHRLSSLENSGGHGPDARTDKLVEQVEDLRRRIAAPNTDPRTDEMALRIASVEGSLRRAKEAFDSETITDQIKELQHASQETTEKVAAELAELRTALDAAQSEEAPDWSERIAEIDSRINEIDAKASSDEISVRIANVERAQENAVSPISLERLTTRVEEIASKADKTESVTLEQVRTEIAELEAKIPASDSGVQTDALNARVDQLHQAVESRPTADVVESLFGRVASLEQQDATSSGFEEAIEELRQRCDALTERVSTVGLSDELETRIASIEAKAEEAPDLSVLRDRLDASETSSPSHELDGRLAELTARLRELELKSEQPATAPNDERVDRLSARLDQLELTGGSSGLTNQISELRDRVAQLASRPAETQGQDTNEAVAQLTERLSAVETASTAASDKINQIENRETTPATDYSDAISELHERLDSLSVASDNGDAAAGDILHELGLRVQALERGAPREGSSDDNALSAIAQRLDYLETKVVDAGSTPSADLQGIVDRLSFLEQSGPSTSGEASGPSPQVMEQLVARYEELDNRLALMEATGPAGGSGAGATSTELSEIRSQIAALEESGPSGDGLSEGFAGKLAERISSGIAGSEVRSIQHQMYAVYFFLALIGAIALSSFFMQ